MLMIQHLKKEYSSKKGLHNLNLTLNKGDLCAFIGHNGAGKTTCLKCLAGIHPYDTGKITLNNVDLNNNPIAYKKQIAYVPDEPTIYPFLSGREYIQFIADIFEIDITNKLEQLASLFEITDALDLPIASYSHGMQQKIILISAFIHEPELLILDEPFVGLDPKATITLKNLMRDYCQQGKIILFSTHVLEVAEKLATKAVIIKDGQVVIEDCMQNIIQSNSLEKVFLDTLNETC